MSDTTNGPGRRRNCPICGKPMAEKYRPFCSKRCADIDLGRWFDGSYSMPAVEPPEGEAWANPEGDEDDAGSGA